MRILLILPLIVAGLLLAMALFDWAERAAGMERQP